MKAKQVAFAAITVFFRIVAVSYVLSQIFTMGSQYIAMRMLGAGSSDSFGLLSVYLFQFAAAAALWALSKPIAFLSSSGLEVGSNLDGLPLNEGKGE